MKKSPITTHVLDTMQGHPAAGMNVVLEVAISRSEWKELATGTTDEDGRVDELLPSSAGFGQGKYRMTFDTARYFQSLGVSAFYPSVSITFEVDDTTQHYHVPLLLSPFGYSTYRGS